MNVVVLGGSGFLGTRLVSILLRDGHQVRIGDVEKSQAYPDLWSSCDIRNDEQLRECFKSCELVINLAAVHRDDVSAASSYYEMNVAGLKNILNIMDELRIKNHIFTSSVAVYEMNSLEPIDETHTPRPFNDYGKSKYQAEIEVENWAAKGGGRKGLVIRPTAIFGEGNRGNVYTLLKQINDGRFLMIGNGRNKKSLAYVGNVAEFISCMMGKERVEYEVFNYVDKPDLSMNELLAHIHKSLKIKRSSFYIPFWIGIMGGRLFDILAKISGKKYPISKVRVKKFCATTRFSAEKAHNTGFQAPYSFEEAFKRTIQFEFRS